MADPPTPPLTAADWNDRSRDFLPGLLGLRITEIGHARALGELAVERRHLAPNGYLHAATVILVADTLCGFGCATSLPDGATGFTTIELKSNFLGTARAGTIAGEARLIHGGRTTQVWDADVRDTTSGKLIATFRCTQLILR